MQVSKREREMAREPSWLVQCLLVSGLALVCYMHSCWGDFVFDDSEAILSNKDILTETPLLNIFKNDFWGTNVFSNNSHKSYRPLTVLTFRINHWIGGMEPFGFHSVNVILHVFVCMLFLRVCVCFWEDFSSSKENWWSSLFAALLFASHPVHTETVAGVVGRADLMSALCFFLALLGHRHTLHCSHSGSRVTLKVILWLFLTAILAGAAMLFKEQGITVIGVCIVYDIVSMRLDPWQLLQLKLPSHKHQEWSYFVTRCSVLLASGLALGGLRLITGSPSFQPTDNPASFHNSTLVRVLNYNYLYSLNSWLLVHPWWLCFDWSMGCVPLITSLSDPRLASVTTFWLVLAGLLLYCLFTKPSPVKRMTTVGLAMIVVPFLPASNVLVSVGFVLAERVLYLPSAGYCILVSVGATVLSKNCGRKVCVVLSVFVVLLFSLRSMTRATDWLSEEALFSSGIRVCPQNAKVLYNIGKVSLDKGNTERGMVAYREAIRLYPEYDQALNNYGNLLKDREMYTEAEDALQRAVTVSPKFAAAWMNLGIVQAAQNKTKEAEESYLTALQYRHKYPDAFYNLGNMYIDTGRPGKAVAAFKEAIRLQNDHTNSWGNLALLYEKMEMFDEAEKLLKEAISIMPDYANFYYSLGVVMGRVNKLKEGEELLLKALTMDPDSAKYHANLGVIYHLRKDYFLAKQHYRRALELDPAMTTAADNLKKLMRTKHN